MKEEKEITEVVIDEENISDNIIIKTKKNKLKTNFIVGLTFLFVVVIIITLFFMSNKFNDRIYHNVYLNGYNVSNMKLNEVSSYITKLDKENYDTIKIKQNGVFLQEINKSDIDFKINNQATIDKITGFGRENNTIINNFKIFKALFKKVNMNIEYMYSNEKLEEVINNIKSNIKGRVINDNYILDEKTYNLVITKGTKGVDIESNIIKSDLIDIFKNKVNFEYNLKTTTMEPKALDVDVLYSNIVRSPKDAYIDKTTSEIKFVKQIIGIDFDKEKLREELNKEKNKLEGTKIEFVLDQIKPEIFLTDIKWDLYEAKISGMTTYFKPSAVNRSSNVKLGLSILDGTIVMPGETFSFNQTIGDCGLKSRGFKVATVYQGGKVAQGVGGGICQVSSTLYNAALFANLDIVKRSQHALPVSYVKPSLDATISYPYLDFKFKNTRKYPIKIVTSYNSYGKITITIMGTLEETEYDIVLTSKVTKKTSPKIEYVNDSTLEEGKTKQISLGVSGYSSYAYRIVKLNSKEVSRQLLSEDTYKAINTIIAVGTKKPNIVLEPTI